MSTKLRRIANDVQTSARLRELFRSEKGWKLIKSDGLYGLLRHSQLIHSLSKSFPVMIPARLQQSGYSLNDTIDANHLKKTIRNVPLFLHPLITALETFFNCHYPPRISPLRHRCTVASYLASTSLSLTIFWRSSPGSLQGYSGSWPLPLGQASPCLGRQHAVRSQRHVRMFGPR
jgi:hypothetical protein